MSPTTLATVVGILAAVLAVVGTLVGERIRRRRRSRAFARRLWLATLGDAAGQAEPVLPPLAATGGPLTEPEERQ